MRNYVHHTCCQVFRDESGLADTKAYCARSDGQLMAASFDELEVDSLTILKFVMTVESRFQIELNDAHVQGCTTLLELCTLVDAACNAANDAR